MTWKGTMQRAAKALMVPIVVMPVAALLLAIGEFGPDFFTAAGNAIIIDFLPLLFAVGVAMASQILTAWLPLLQLPAIWCCRR